MITNERVILRMFVPLLVLMTTLGISSTVVGQTYPEGMIAYWKFDEGSGTIAYSSVGQHTGTVSGPDWIAGQVGGALYFEGAPVRTPEYNDHVVVPHHEDLNVPSNEISIEAWVNFMGEVGAWDHQIVSKTASYASFGYQLRLANGLLSLAIFNGQYPTGSCCLTATFQMPYGWHHVVGIYSDAQDLARLYMDGALVAENTSFNTVLDNSGNTSDLFIGKWNSGPSPDEWHLWKGAIDEVAIYNQILLPEEIAEHYQNGLNGLGYEIRIISVAIDIKPGSDPNSINLKSKGVIPVAILTTDHFNAATVDPLSVEFGPNGAKETHGKGHLEDVDGDGDQDMVLHFKTQQTEIQCGQTAATLTGETIVGIAITGTDAIQTLGCSANKAVAETETGIPESCALFQNYPNPFNPETEIGFQLPEANHVVVKIFNTLGEEIRTLVEAPYEAGHHRVRWDGKDKNGNPVASRIYLYQLQAGDFSQVRKMALLR